MLKILENKLTMFMGVASVLTENTAKTDGIPALRTLIGRFTEVVREIDATLGKVETVTIGKARAKGQAEEELIPAARSVAAAVYAYAGMQKDAELQERADISVRTLRRLRDTELANRAAMILDLARGAGAGVADYGLTEAVLADLETKTRVFGTALAEAEAGVAQRIGARARMMDLFDEADHLLCEEIDRLMPMLRETEKDFCSKYFAARAIKDLGIRHRKPKEEQEASV